MKRHLILLFSTLALLGSSAFAQTVPDRINYQGNVKTATGLVGAGTAVTRPITFKFYKVATGGTATDLLWTEIQQVSILDGNFSVLLGSGSGVPAGTNTGTFQAVFANTSLYLGITVDVDNVPSNDTEITPRQQLVTTAFAFRAGVAAKVDDAAINGPMIAASAVSTAQLGAGAVTVEKIATSAVTTTQILDGSIGADDLGTGAVNSAKILDGSITGADIAAGTIEAADIADNAVTSSKVLDATLTSADIAPGTIALASLVQAVRESLVPAGTVVAYGGEVAPNGWAMCDGGTLTRTAEPALFAAIGTRFGAPLVTTFNVPDLRGRFIRGWNANQTGEARDPDASAAIANGGRKASMSGGDSGDKIGSLQFDDIKAHTHPEKTVANSPPYNVQGTTSGGYGWPNAVTDTTTGTMRLTDGILSGKETRPANVYLNYIIKK